MSNPSMPDEPVRWLSGDEQATWMTLNAMLMTLPVAIDAQLKRDAGMNFFEYSILAGLSDSPTRTLRMTVLAHLSAGSISRLSHAVTRLERHGWVRRRTPSGEPRRTEVVLTEAGMEALAAAAPQHVREARRLVLDVLTPAQLGQLRRISRTLLHATAPESAAVLDDFIEQAGRPTSS